MSHTIDTLFLVGHGKDNGERATIPWVLANLEVEKPGRKVEVIFIFDGVTMAIPGNAAGFNVGVPFETYDLRATHQGLPEERRRSQRLHAVPRPPRFARLTRARGDRADQGFRPAREEGSSQQDPSVHLACRRLGCGGLATAPPRATANLTGCSPAWRSSRSEGAWLEHRKLTKRCLP